LRFGLLGRRGGFIQGARNYDGGPIRTATGSRFVRCPENGGWSGRASLCFRRRLLRSSCPVASRGWLGHVLAQGERRCRSQPVFRFQALLRPLLSRRFSHALGSGRRLGGNIGSTRRLAWRRVCSRCVGVCELGLLLLPAAPGGRRSEIRLSLPVQAFLSRAVAKYQRSLRQGVWLIGVRRHGAFRPGRLDAVNARRTRRRRRGSLSRLGKSHRRCRVLLIAWPLPDDRDRTKQGRRG
jgi:hypothetical protein